MNIEEEIEVDIEQEVGNEESSTTENITSPFATKDIKVSNANISLASLVSRLEHNEIDLNPDFQRNANLWDRKKMSRLIESLLLKLPLPVFYFDVSNPDKWIVVDGLQRLSTLKRFVIEKNLRLYNLEFLKELNNKNYEELDRSFKRVIDETQIVTYQIEAQTPKEVRYSIFNRINTGGLSLNSQEIRQALNQKGQAVSFLARLCETETFKQVAGISPRRMADRELVLRYIAFKFYRVGRLEKYSDMSNFLDRAMEMLDEITNQQELDRIADDFKETLIFSEEILGKGHKFSRSMVLNEQKRSLNRSLFDVLTACFDELDNKESLIAKKDEFMNEFSTLLKDDKSDFSRAITEGTSSKVAIETRFQIMRELIKGVTNG